MARRERNPADMPVHAGVMVLAGAGMARRLAAGIPDISIPDELVRVSTYRQVGARLETMLRGERS